MDAWTYQNLAYLPITKNASTTFTDFFKSRNWALTQLDLLPREIKVFGHFRDPIERHFKGTAEFLMQNQLEHLVDDPTWQQIYTQSVMDMHSMPITWALGERYKLIHWIPIHKQIPTVLLTQKWLNANGFDCNIENLLWKNIGSDNKLSLYHKLQHLHQTIRKNDSLSFYYDNDFILWNSLWPYVDTDGIKHSIF
jgi:hypothetical protein